MAARRSGRRLPGSRDVFDRVDALARNLWWTWNPDPQRLFAALDPPLWEATHRNPVLLLYRLSAARRAVVAADATFAKLLAACEDQLKRYLTGRTWFAQKATAAQRRVRVAYFSAEYGVHECLPMYSGGLGVLAGDHLKSASDLGIPLVAVGLIYRQGFYSQHLDVNGKTIISYPDVDPAALPLIDTGVTVTVPLGKRAVRAHVWEARVGRVPLYLLDTDVVGNRPADRTITARLYGGDQETRIRQEIVLGVGGVRALRALDVRANVFHLNEGHAAFCNLERLRELHAAGRSAGAALREVRRTTVFTTHTPVPAGHDRFPPPLMNRYFGPQLDEFGLARELFLGLGRERPADRREPFCMTVLALRTADRCNGVSAIHGRVSREMWTSVFGVDADHVPIGHVTNGIHSATWLAAEMRPLYDRYLKPRWVGASPADNPWKNAGRIPLETLWELRNLLRRKLVHFIRRRVRQQIERRCAPLADLLAVLTTFDEHALTIGFARRFATYKRAPLIFNDARRLAALLNDPRRPVQLVFAGKAHPADGPGQAYVQKVYRYAQQAGFRGRVVLVEDYDMHVGRLLTAGVDVWLNTPLKPREASGTSGMKPPLHGGLNCSILDGWWPECYDGRNGWAVDSGKEGVSGPAQDKRDAAALYKVLEDDLVPLFYERGRDGLPRQWLRRAIASMRTVCPQFNTHRMLAEYLRLYAGEE